MIYENILCPSELKEWKEDSLGKARDLIVFSGK